MIIDGKKFKNKPIFWKALFCLFFCRLNCFSMRQRERERKKKDEDEDDVDDEEKLAFFCLL